MQRILFILITILLAGNALWAQEQQDNRITAYFDNRETLDVLNAETAAESHVFTDIKDMKEARAFKSGNTYLVEFADSDDHISSKTYTESEFEDIRHRVTNAIIARDRHLKGNTIFSHLGKRFNNNKRIQYSQFYENESKESGHNTLIVSTSLLSTFLYGPQVSNLTTKPNSGAAILPWAATLYGTTIAAWQYAEHYPVSYGAAAQFMGSSLLGQLHGELIYAIITPVGKDQTRTGLTGARLVTSLTEGALGLYVAQKSGITAGQSIMATGTAFWMLPEALALVVGFNKTYNVHDPAIVNGFVLGSSLYGYFLGYSLTKIFSYTIGDAIVYNNVMMVSGLVAYAAAISYSRYQFSTGNINLAGGIAALFAPVGIYASEALLKGKDFKSSQGIVISLATLGGGAASSLILNNTRVKSRNPIRIVEHFLYGAVTGFTLSYLYETKFAQTGLLGKLNTDNMRLVPTLCNTSPQGQVPSLSNTGLGFEFNWKF